MKTRILISVLCLAGQALLAQYAQQSNPTVLELGRLPSGATVSFIRDHADFNGKYVIAINGGAAQPSILSGPARIEVYRADDDIRRLGSEYQTVQKSANGIDARAEIAYSNNVVFHVQDHWSLTGWLSVVGKIL